ncbi:MAG: hypothetical protein H6Q73_2563 [Firmicutes bacterium]|nr:hypothetical protein [Bacillota bacterium]
MIDVDNSKIKETLLIAAAVLAIVNNSIQLIERLLKGLRWLKRKLERLIAKQKPTNVAPRKHKRRK